MWARWLYPELRYFPDRQYGADVVHRYMRVNRVAAKFGLLLLFAGGPTMVVLAQLLDPFGKGMALLGIPGTVGLWYLLALAYLRPRVRRFLREKLQYAGFAICVACGYDLRGQQEPRCPECGAAFDAALQLRADDVTRRG